MNFIRESIESVLRQTFLEFELLVIDDCSTDDTPGILASYRDSRVRSLRTERTLGVVGARNFGVSHCRGAYIAALDHDDLCYPERLSKQIGYLEQNPEVLLVGTEVRISEGLKLRETDHAPGSTPALVRWMMHVDNPLTYSSIMIRASAVQRLGIFMRSEYEFADDYDLYHRLLQIGEIARLDEPLTVYRWHARNTSRTHGKVLFDNAVKVLSAAYARWLQDEAEASAKLVIRHLSDRAPVTDAATLDRLGSLLETLLERFLADYQIDSADRARIEAHAARVWWRVVRSSVRVGLPWLLLRHKARPSLISGFRPKPIDILLSVAIGWLRSSRFVRRAGAVTRTSTL